MCVIKRVLAFALLTVLSGCAISPEAKEAKYLKRGQKSFDAKSFSRAAVDFKNAARQMPKHAEAYYRLGITYLELGDGPTGIGMLQKALSIDSNHVPAKVKLSEVMALSDSSDVVREAERMSREAVTAAKDNADAIATLALAELRLGKEANAEMELRRTLARFPAHFKSSTVLATALLAKGDLEGAEQVMKEAAVRNPSSALPELALARIAGLLSNPAGIEAHLRRALQSEPENDQALLDLGALQLQSGKKDEAAKTFQALSKIAGGKHRSAYALYLFNLGRKEAGTAELERLYRSYPSDREMRTQLIAAYFSTGKLSLAEAVLNEVLKKNEEDVDALEQRSQLELKRGAYAQAAADLNRVLRYQPDSAQVHFLLARLNASQGNLLNEKRELNEAIAHDPSLLPARIELAQALTRSGSANAVLDLMEKAPPAQLRSMPAIVERNWALLHLHNLPELRKGIDEGLAGGRAPELLIQDALYFAQLKDYKRARIQIQEALQRAPGDARALDVMVRLLTAQNETAAALQTVKAFVDKQPGSVETQLYAGNYFMRAGYKEEARSAFAQAKAAGPEILAADLSMAQLNVLEGNLNGARKTLQYVVERRANAEDARVLLGMVEEQSGEYASAVSQFHKVLETQPNNVIALNNIAFRLANNLNRADEALPYAQKAGELAPDNPAVNDSMGWVFYQKGMYSNALQYLRRAVGQHATPTREYHLAMTYARLGNKSKAEQALLAAEKLDPNLPESQTAHRLLAQLR